jgi:hypothetical protein
MRRLTKMTSMSAPRVQISWGELIDKITILEIKKRRLHSRAATANVYRELTALNEVANRILSTRKGLQSLKQQLKSVNDTLWKIEDKIRAKEATKSFDREFVKLARSVYINNDKRGPQASD